MKLTINAATPAGVVEQIRELATRSAKIERENKQLTNRASDQKACEDRARSLDAFVDLISDVTVEMATQPVKLRAADLLADAIGLMGGEPAGDGESRRWFANAEKVLTELREGVKERPPVGNALGINMYMHCGKCLAELKKIAELNGSASPRDYARLSVGWTKQGLQVWCNRHHCNVLHVDFEGCQHPADTTAPLESKGPLQ